MIPNESRFIVTRLPHPFGVETEIRFAYRTDTGMTFVAKPVEFTAIKPEEIAPLPNEPMLRVLTSDSQGHQVIQSLLDQLWQLGYRPTDIGTAGHLAATQKHLEDMRALASHMLKVELPK